MNITYAQLKQNPSVFKQLTGVGILEFQQIAQKMKPSWEAEMIKKKQPGRPSKLAKLEDRLLALLIYYHTSISHKGLGDLFGVHNANISRQFKQLAPLIPKDITIKKDPKLTPEKIHELLAKLKEKPTQAD